VFFADPTNVGFYGFPAHPKENVLKLAFHSVGYVIKDQIVDKASLERKFNEILKTEETRFRKFLKEHIPALQDAEILYKRLCMYSDTFDGNFFIDHDPDTSGLFVASGGSGHGFKFAPIIGRLIADSFERKENKYRSKFAWRFPKSNSVKQFDVVRYVENPTSKM